MESRELMINDFVQQKDSGYRIKITLVREGFVEGKKEDGEFAENTIEPIPLSEKILDNNGFDGSEDNDSSLLSYVFYDGYNVVIDDGKKSVVNVGPIWTVHELQHALRLCGMNELADNLKV